MSVASIAAHRPTVLLAEDRLETAEQLRELLETQFEVVAMVSDGRTLVSEAARLSPDVVVTDISMPALDGIDAAVLIRKSDPSARIVLVTVHSEALLVARGLAAGVLGYVLKDAAGDDLVPAIRAALAGQRFVSGALAGPENEDCRMGTIH